MKKLKSIVETLSIIPLLLIIGYVEIFRFNHPRKTNTEIIIMFWPWYLVCVVFGLGILIFVCRSKK